MARQRKTARFIRNWPVGTSALTVPGRAPIAHDRASPPAGQRSRGSQTTRRTSEGHACRGTCHRRSSIRSNGRKSAGSPAGRARTGSISSSSAPSPAPWGCRPAPGVRAESTRPSRQSDPAPHIPGPARSSARLRSETTGRLPRRSPSPGRADSFGTQQCRGPVPHLLFAAAQTASIHPVEDSAELPPLALRTVLVYEALDRAHEPPPYPLPQAGEGK